MCALGALPRQEESFQPAHMYPPFAGDINGALKDMCFGWTNGTSIREIAIDPKALLGRGGFGCAYKAKGPNGVYAVKIFHPQRVFRSWQAWRDREKIIEEILNNLYAQREQFSPAPFATLRIVPDGNRLSALPPFYAMDYLEGVNVDDAVKASHATGIPFAQHQRDLAGQSALAFAHALRHAHEQKLVLLDPKWPMLIGSVANGFGICDLDFVSPEADVNAHLIHEGDARMRQAFLVSTQEYAPGAFFRREYRGCEEDLQSFAAMLDEIFIGGLFATTQRPVDDEPNMSWRGLQCSRGNRDCREYPDERKQRLPGPLREPIARLMTWPPDRNVTLEEVTAGIQEEFGLQDVQYGDLWAA